MRRPYLIDECLGKPMADILGVCVKNVDFKLLTAYFPNSIRDTEWLPQVAGMRPQPIILSSDFKMSKREMEIRALRDHGLTAVLVMGFDKIVERMSFRERVWRLLRGWPEIEEALNTSAPLIIGFHMRSFAIKVL